MKNLIIILAFFSLSISAQTNNVYTKYGNSAGKLNNSIWYFNTLGVGKVLQLKASSISEDSLTYNPSGNLVTDIDDINVTLDGGDEVVIGNSVRFGTPASGTIYQVVDTGATAANLVLDQTFTGSVTDEYYWGGVDTWYDESVEETHLYQSSPVSMPKLLWTGTSEAKLFLDGVNDYMYFADYEYIDKVHTIFSVVKFNRLSPTNAFLTYSTIDNYRFAGNGVEYRINSATSITSNLFYINTDYYVTTIRDNTDLDLYIDGDYISSSIIAGSNNVEFIMKQFGRRDVAADLYFSGEVKNILIYNRVLLSKELDIINDYYISEHTPDWANNLNLHNTDTIPLLTGIPYNLQDDEISLIPIGKNSNVTYEYTSNIGSYTSNRGNLINNTIFQKSGNYSITPTAPDIGAYNINVKVKYKGVQKGEINKVFKVLNGGNGTGTKNIMFVGNSVTTQGENTMIDSVRKGLTGITPQMVGSYGTPPNEHSAVSGWTYARFLSSDSPFWNGSEINITDYRIDSLGLGSPIDFVIINLGINDVIGSAIDTDDILNTIMPNVESLISKFIQDATVNIIIACPTNSENSGVGWYDDYGDADQNYYQEKMIFFRQQLLDTYGSFNYANNVYVSMHANFVDRDDGYPVDGSGNHNNGVHPGTGQYKIANNVLAIIENILSQ